MTKKSNHAGEFSEATVARAPAYTDAFLDELQRHEVALAADRVRGCHGSSVTEKVTLKAGNLLRRGAESLASACRWRR